MLRHLGKIYLLLHILEITEAGEEIMNKYKVLNINLSLVTKMQESNNELDETEQNKFIRIY